MAGVAEARFSPRQMQGRRPRRVATAAATRKWTCGYSPEEGLAGEGAGRLQRAMAGRGNAGVGAPYNCEDREGGDGRCTGARRTALTWLALISHTALYPASSTTDPLAARCNLLYSSAVSSSMAIRLPIVVCRVSCPRQEFGKRSRAHCPSNCLWRFVGESTCKCRDKHTGRAGLLTEGQTAGSVAARRWRRAPWRGAEGPVHALTTTASSPLSTTA